MTASDVALFGKDATPRIVDVQRLRSDRDTDPAAVRLYIRSADGTQVTSEDAPLYPFFFCADVALLRDFDRSRYRFQPLHGDNYYRHLVVFTRWRDYWDAIRHIERVTERAQGRPEELYLINNPAQQYLMQSGRTCFTDMAFDDLHRLQLDIEVASSAGFPDAERPEDEIIIVALSDNRGWQSLLHMAPEVEVPHGIGFETEADLLRHLVNVLREQDPDVIEGHNFYAFDAPYVMTRCKRYGISFAIGRDGSEPRSFPSSMRFAERTIDFPALDIAGRHVVDTLFQVMSFDLFKRNMPGYSLKVAARYFGFAPEGRTYVAGDAIAGVWRSDPKRLLDYALDDVIETERLARHLSGSTFYLTQMLPMTYGQVARTGPASKIESLFVREYLRQRHALPKSEWGSQAVGGYTDVFITGVVGPVVYADVESLYPSIMLNYDVKPRRDTLGLFPDLLQRLTDLRFEAKGEMRRATDANLRAELDARQTSYKNLINSFYGNLGFSLAAF
ncbi:MAG: 3'-5' exonuclease, partial [Bacteroidota bacterium]